MIDAVIYGVMDKAITDNEDNPLPVRVFKKPKDVFSCKIVLKYSAFTPSVGMLQKIRMSIKIPRVIMHFFRNSISLLSALNINILISFLFTYQKLIFCQKVLRKIPFSSPVHPEDLLHL